MLLVNFQLFTPGQAPKGPGGHRHRGRALPARHGQAGRAQAQQVHQGRGEGCEWCWTAVKSPDIISCLPTFVKIDLNDEYRRLLKLRVGLMRCRAEALYELSMFERSLIYFHRCARDRPDMAVEFKRGLKKAHSAIGKRAIDIMLQSGWKFERHDCFSSQLSHVRLFLKVSRPQDGTYHVKLMFIYTSGSS